MEKKSKTVPLEGSTVALTGAGATRAIPLHVDTPAVGGGLWGINRRIFGNWGPIATRGGPAGSGSGRAVGIGAVEVSHWEFVERVGGWRIESEVWGVG